MFQTDVQKTDVDFFIAPLNPVRRFGIDDMRSLSKRGAKIHPFEPQFSLQGAFHGKLTLSGFFNGECEATDKAYF